MLLWSTSRSAVLHEFIDNDDDDIGGDDDDDDHLLWLLLKFITTVYADLICQPLNMTSIT